uniref:scinderin-like n=1 Tax=Myxine glutinosa TaxID=7769 RepID=UPI00358EE5F5
MPEHPAFKTAGQSDGLQIWRIEKMQPVAVPREQHSTFFNGDAYILLHTTSFGGKAKNYALHFWLGNECSQDESTSAAILTIQLDDQLGGMPVQYREVQGHESVKFMSLFKGGVQYKMGGVNSGFRHVQPNAADVKRLLHVKGRRNVRSYEVPLSWSSFNQGDGFIIDLGKKIYVWCGSECNRYERTQASAIARGIRDNERNGRAQVEIVENGEETKEIIQVLGEKKHIADGSSDDDDRADILNQKSASLHKVSDANGRLEVTKVASKTPFKQQQLDTNDCFLLDNGSAGTIFLWKGKGANTEERAKGMIYAQDFIKKNNYPQSTKIQVLPEGGETTEFQQFFFDWRGPDDVRTPGKTYTLGSVAQVKQVPFDASTLHTSAPMAAHHGMVDDGKGKVEIWRIEGGGKAPVDCKSYGQLYGGDCYLILYTYRPKGSQKQIIYFWQGQKASKDEVTSSAFHAVQLDDELGGSPVQVRVCQGYEPTHLMSIFGGKPLIVHAGGTCKKTGQAPMADTRLYHIRKSSSGATRAVETSLDASALNSNDVFVLKTPAKTFVWKGKGANSGEVEAATYVASVLGGVKADFSEGAEPEEFWKALGGKKNYQTSSALASMSEMNQIRLFACSNKTGNFKIEEVPGDLMQTDLATDDVMLLDTSDQLFIWIGKDSNEVERTQAPKCAADYLNSAPSGKRSSIPVVTVKQGNEPPTFTGWFQAWDLNLFK